MPITPDAPVDVAVKPVPLSAAQQHWLDAALALVDEERMRTFNRDITAIHSPTGEERAINEWMTQHMREMGLQAFYQPVDERSGNAVGRLPGRGGGPSLLLYAPIDTHLQGDPAEDVPWVGPELRPDMLPAAYIADNGDVIGLGAANPKGMVTALTEAVRCVCAAGVPLMGEVVLAFAGGGMPSMPPRRAVRQNHGLSSGVIYMLTHGITADFAIIGKPGWAAAWEEVGLCWFKVTVRGQMGYAGMTRTFPNFRNAIVHAATFILALEEWLPAYQERNTSGLCAPQGAIAAIRGGWPHKPAFSSAAVEVYVDLRCNPRTPPAAVKAQFAQALEAICARHPELTLDWEMYAAYPGSYTDPENWIVQSAMRGWEFVEGTTHHALTGTSGQTDASALRNLGIPTVRLGYPPVPTIPPEWQGFGGLGVSHIPHLAKVTRAIIYAVIDTCTRSRAEVGLR
ncbi:MAG: peptidase dimerization domain-containing protein [candidate division KSB1 bacterium]|nr:peptidase dimerization domain-containing protein [candidate division KSB1 bacterium]